MSLYLNDENEGQAPLASNQGWGDFSAWVGTLPVADAPDLIQLVEHGWSEKVTELRAQLAEALRTAPPSRDVRSVAATLLEELPGATVLIVSDGMQPGSDEDGDGGNETKSADEDAAGFWTPADIDAAAKAFGEEDVKQAIALRTPDVQRLLRASEEEE